MGDRPNVNSGQNAGQEDSCHEDHEQNVHLGRRLKEGVPEGSGSRQYHEHDEGCYAERTRRQAFEEVRDPGTGSQDGGPK